MPCEPHSTFHLVCDWTVLPEHGRQHNVSRSLETIYHNPRGKNHLKRGKSLRSLPFRHGRVWRREKLSLCIGFVRAAD